MDEELRMSLRVPLVCPVCGGLMKGKSTNTWYDYRCCVECYIYFLEARPAKIKQWMEGWRPSPVQIDQKWRAFGREDVEI